MTHTPSATAALAQLRRLLDSIGDAVVGTHVDALLATESQLEAALHTLRTTPPFTPDDQYRLELARCVAALGRCRRLGDATLRLSSGLLQIAGAPYTRAGDVAPSRHAGRLEARG
ncbi:MAG: hypothetical protein AB7I50_03705 [Vicinamibacterales bacterium]